MCLTTQQEEDLTMNETTQQRITAKPANYNRWVVIFCLGVLVFLGLFYYATQKIQYVWRWNRTPIYFAYQDDIDITSTIDGEVSAIAIDGSKARITVLGIGEEETYVVPAKGLRVDQGDFISPGDTLASYKKWKPGLLVVGLWITLKISVLATIVGVIIGIISGLMRISDNPALRWTSIVYVELIRGSPLMVQILVWYFVLGTLINDLLSANGWGQIPALWYGVASLACFAGAYVSEIVRGGIQSIHRGQTEAARSLGMNYAQSMRYIILPQALRRILPPLAGQFISLIKDSSLLGIIAIRELTKAAREAVTATLQPFEVYILLGLLYLVLTFSLSMYVQYLERRMATS
ncbi:ABC transporter permease [Desulfosarcina ovata subsp. sediminis]|uniref:Putative glutamine transport system permease protein GlnP n=2 Tax=Desulfosarcina ovata TaxID=83564 RepID=A0A5K7ZN31_9BACT|nr:ABC transporter permease [Desulfosarcina ovata subsp. sediminis]